MEILDLKQTIDKLKQIQTDQASEAFAIWMFLNYLNENI